MGKIYYQPIVIKIATELITIFRESYFFTDNKIESEDYAMDYMCNVLTQKLIDGVLNEEQNEELFTDEEMETYLSEIVTYNLLNNLKNKGLLNTIEDENNEEGFFLTELGKEIVNELKKDK